MARSGLSRREREIMDILYRLGSAPVARVRQELSHPPSYSATRALLRILEEKGHARHSQQGLRFVFTPTVPRERARRSALRGLLDTFFEGSPSQVMSALLEPSDRRTSPLELARMARLIDAAKKEGR